MWEKLIRRLPISILLLLPITSFASNPAVEDALNHARKLIKNKKANLALPYLNKANSLDPDNPEARLLRADILVQLDECPEALKDLDVVFKHGKNDQAYAYRSQVMFALGEPKKALEDMSVAISMATNEESRAYRLQRRAELYRFLKQPEKALEDLNTAMTLKNVPNPNVASMVLLKRRAYTYMDMGDYKRAIADYTAVLAMTKPNDLGRARNYAMRAAAYEKIGRHDLAEADRKKSKVATDKDWVDCLDPK